ncbi:Kunitz/Bovine pancreatic trypsin inhibitor domain protein [Trichostrongylus colubriformis]|uniref:Kunitz/Bovine pancreatic trypsin inhibitor domain protein n=1 Tax=Trichostrongylus colubriformis TaxID=6319 RepID=A0AAN8FQ94_TRICO
MLPLWLLFVVAEAQELLSNPRCNLPMDRGTCSKFTVQWYYDRYAHRCREFHYGGCEGNANRFSSFEECNAACRYVPQSNRERCFQPHDPGHCSGNFERWYFDANKRQCVCSWWSGCGGNTNLFYSYKHCMLICGEFATGGAGIDEKYYNRTYLLPSIPGTRTHTETTLIWYQPPYPAYPGPGPAPQVTFVHGYQPGYVPPQPQPQPHPHPHPHPHPQPQPQPYGGWSQPPAPDRGPVPPPGYVPPQPQPQPRPQVQPGYVPPQPQPQPQPRPPPPSQSSRLQPDRGRVRQGYGRPRPQQQPQQYQPGQYEQQQRQQVCLSCNRSHFESLLA